MNSKISALLATLLVAAAPLAGAANVAAGAAVTTAPATGSGFGLSAGWAGAAPADPSTLTDGAFVADGQQWNTGTVFWQGAGSDTADTITIALGGAASVTGLFLQGDNNDIYSVSYEDLGGTWHALAALGPHGSIDPTYNGGGGVYWGMGTASTSFAAVTAQAFQITAGGDGSYAVSEFQATGEFLPAVPETGTSALMLAGLASLGLIARRRSVR